MPGFPDLGLDPDARPGFPCVMQWAVGGTVSDWVYDFRWRDVVAVADRLTPRAGHLRLWDAKPDFDRQLSLEAEDGVLMVTLYDQSGEEDEVRSSNLQPGGRMVAFGGNDWDSSHFTRDRDFAAHCLAAFFATGDVPRDLLD